MEKCLTIKKAAEAHDKMLELAANITELIENSINGISEAHSEAIGLLLAGKSDLLAKACRGKPELLLEEAPSSSVTPLLASQ